MDTTRILLDHGAGGRASHNLVNDLFLKHFAPDGGQGIEDCAVLDLGPGRIAFSTDTFVVTPIFFPGGDIGDLAVNGTVNDLAMRGARPRFLSVGFILEEGLPLEDLERVVVSMARAARNAGVRIAAGDTKVVPHGAADRLFINTAGIGSIPDGLDISATKARPGDQVLISGTMADHGLAVLCQREGLTLSNAILSDTAPLGGLVQTMIEAGGPAIHVLRDPTRGGVGTSLNEIALASGVGVVLDETRLPVDESVQGACDLLGLEPLYVANEGKLLAFVAPDAAQDVLRAMHGHPLGRRADFIGRVEASRPGQVWMETAVGGARIVDMLTGEQLPRIC
ncbi:MAG: hydrogenase expression/formation protein HypE [Proteobacteria bacterium]|nr:hydrogenase expression/formation protein HypE [Pseudomonadota bacterium]